VFSSSYFSPEYFGEYFKITGEVTYIDTPGGGGGKAVNVNQRQLRALKLGKDDQDILEFIVAFVLSR